MRQLSRIVLVLLLAALPLRGMAAVVAELCGPGQGAAMAQDHGCCAEGEAHAAGAHHGDDEHSAEGSCSHCAACSVGAPVVSEAASLLSDALPGVAAIPFRDRVAPSFVPEVLDRPPLAS